MRSGSAAAPPSEKYRTRSTTTTAAAAPMAMFCRSRQPVLKSAGGARVIECVRASVAIERVDQEARADATPRTPTRTRLVRRHAVSCPKLRRGQVRITSAAALVIALAQLARAEGRVTTHRVLPVWRGVWLRNAWRSGCPLGV